MSTTTAQIAALARRDRLKPGIGGRMATRRLLERANVGLNVPTEDEVPARSAGRDGPSRFQVLQRGDRAVQAGDLDDPQAGGHRALDVGAVEGRREEDGGSRVARGHHLELD